MIHVLCPNPAIDKVYRIDGFTAGEDYPGQRPEVYAGGKGVNVARVLSELGEAVHLYAFLGEMGGEAVRADMEARCACTFLRVPGACRTTVNILDRANARETVITEAGPQVSAQDVQALLAALGRNVQPGDMVCCSGSLIAGAPGTLYAQVSRLAGELGAACALDCNAATLSASLEGARYALGKPNERELCALLGEMRTQEPREIAALARRLMPPYAALLVSLGAQGGVYVTPQRAWRARVPDAPVRSTVGSGDASFAGALCALRQGLSAPETLRLSMACGVVNASRGGNGSVDAAQVRQTAAQIQIETLQ